MFADSILYSRNLEYTFLAAGVEHHDSRPATVLRAADRTLRLIDFGYSIIVEPRTDFCSLNYMERYICREQYEQY